jgi:hypothetical protein
MREFHEVGLGLGLILRADEYRSYATTCVQLAREASDENDKALLLEMAQKWRELAQKAERPRAIARADEPGSTCQRRPAATK